MIETIGYGDSQQMTSESTTSDLQRNRRVEFSILVRRDGTAGGY
jgi:outer membrane protein OmpA-like peptidoglycan-associated protein